MKNFGIFEISSSKVSKNAWSKLKISFCEIYYIKPDTLPSNHRGIMSKTSNFLIFIKMKFSKTENLEKTCEDKYSQKFDKNL